MKTLILIALAAFSFVALASHTPEHKCETCSKVESILKSNEEDEKKGYKDFNEFVGTVELSKDKKVLADEIKSIVKATPTFLKNDERRELPSYLVDIQEKNPKEFSEALKELSKEDREDLERKMTAAKKNMAEGEDP